MDRADPAPASCHAAGSQEQLLAEKLAKSEQKRQRLRANLQKFRDKLIDTNKLLELFNEVKREKELAEQQAASLATAARELETVRRQQTEDRRKLEEARDQLADKAREVKDLDAINARLRLKIDTSVAEGTQRVTRELERCKKDKQAAQQAKELAERRARQADSRLKTEQALVAELRQQLKTIQSGQSTSVPTTGASNVADSAQTFHPAQLNDMTAAISTQLQDSLQQIVLTEVKKAVQSPAYMQVTSAQAANLAASTSQVEALRATMEERFQDLSAAVQNSARKHSIDQVEKVQEVGSDSSTTAELLHEMRWIRRSLTQDGPPHLPIGPSGAAGPFAAIADGGDPPGIHPSSIRDRIESSRQEDESEEGDAASFALELEEALSADADPDTEVVMHDDKALSADADPDTEVVMHDDSDDATPSKQSRSTKMTVQWHEQEVQQGSERPARMSELEIDTPRSSKRKQQRSADDRIAGTSGTTRHLDRAEFEARLSSFYSPHEVPTPISCGERIDLFLLYQLVAELGGPDQTGKLRQWATVGRKLAQSASSCSDVAVPSNAGNIAKSNYSKYISPAVGDTHHWPVTQQSQIRVESESEQNLSRKRARVVPTPPASNVVPPETSAVARLWNTMATCPASDSSKQLETILSQFAGQQLRSRTQECSSEPDGQAKYRQCLTELMKLSSRVAAFRRGGNAECGCDDSVQVCVQVERCLVAAAGPALYALRTWCEAMVLATSESVGTRASGRYTVESVAVVWCDAILSVANAQYTRYAGGSRRHEGGSTTSVPIEDSPSGVACAFLALLCHLLDHSKTFPTVAAGLSTALLQSLHRRLLSCDPDKDEVTARHFGYTFGFLCKQRGAMDAGRVCLYELLRHRADVELAVVDAICAGWPELGPITGKGNSVDTSVGEDTSPRANGSKWWLRHTMAWTLTVHCADLSTPDDAHHDRSATDSNSNDLNEARHFWTRLRPTWDLTQTSSGARSEFGFLEDLLKATLESEPELAVDDGTLDLRLSAGLAGRMKGWMWLHKNWIRPTLLPLVTQEFKHSKQSILSVVGNSACPPSSTKHQLNAIRLLGELAVTVTERSAMKPVSTVKQGEAARPDGPSSAATELRPPDTSHVWSTSVTRSHPQLSSSDELVDMIVGALAERVAASRSHVCPRADAFGTRLSNSNGGGQEHGTGKTESTSRIREQNQRLHSSSTTPRRDCACQCGGGCSTTTACVMATAASDALARISAVAGVE